jgi:hypothetical protein
LRELAADQIEVLAAAAHAAAAEAAELGERVSDQVRDRLVQTLRASMADPDAAGVVTSGRLVRDLDSPGFGPVDLDGAMAVPSGVQPYTPTTAGAGRPSTGPTEVRARGADARRTKPSRPKPDSRTQKRAQQRAQARLDEATRTAEELGAELASVSEELSAGKSRLADLQSTEKRLRDELAGVSAELERAKADLREANKRHADLERRTTRSRFAVRRAQAELDELS